MNKLLLMSSMSLLFTGCASLKDFQAMDAHTRAQFVCSRDNDFKQFRNAELNYKNKVEDINDALMRGYRIHESCNTIKVETPESVSCQSYGTGDHIHTDCTQHIHTSYEEVCTEIPVSIDTSLEKENLKTYFNLMQNAETDKNTSYQNCYSMIHPMSAEQAFSYYDK